MNESWMALNDLLGDSSSPFSLQLITAVDIKMLVQFLTSRNNRK